MDQTVNKSTGRPREYYNKDPETCLGPLVENCKRCDKIYKCLRAYFHSKGILKKDKSFAVYGKISNLVVDFYLPKVKPTAWKLYTYLNAHCVWDPENPDYGVCFTTSKKIAKGTGLSEKHIYEHAQHLEILGLVIRETRHRGNKKIGYKKNVKWILKCYQRERELAKYF